MHTTSLALNLAMCPLPSPLILKTHFVGMTFAPGAIADATMTFQTAHFLSDAILS